MDFLLVCFLLFVLSEDANSDVVRRMKKNTRALGILNNRLIKRSVERMQLP